ncbi:MAG: dephospho-CoA kinase [Planctomycetota bacterium]|nr:dephospho-CoA kinase [Planctomycetota bacterium]
MTTANSPTSPTTARRKPVLGLIGGIGSGKSFVASLFARLGCGVVDADEIARQTLADPEVVAQLKQWWGPAVIDAAGQVDRRAVAGIVFADPAQRQRLEALVHPRVNEARARRREALAKDPAIVAIIEDTPLLLEKGLEGVCDHLVFVEASHATRLARVKATRGWTEADLIQREKSQVGLDIKASRADYVVDNNDGEAACFPHVRRVLSQILQDQT